VKGKKLVWITYALYSFRTKRGEVVNEACNSDQLSSNNYLSLMFRMSLILDKYLSNVKTVE